MLSEAKHLLFLPPSEPSVETRKNRLSCASHSHLAAVLTVLFSLMLYGCAGTRSRDNSQSYSPNSVLEVLAVIDDASLQRSSSQGSTTGEGEPLVAAPVSIALPAAPRSGPLFIADRQTGRVLAISDSGTLINDAFIAGGGHLSASRPPRFIRLDLGDNLYVCDGDAGHVMTYDAHFRPGADLTPPYDALGIAPGRITGLALGAYGEIYLVDGTNARVYHFDSSGRFLAVITGEESGWARLIRPEGAACAANDGSVYVCDPGQRRVVVFDNAGSPSRSFGESDLNEPVAVAIDRRGQAYVADTRVAAILVFDTSGRLVGRIDGASLGVPPLAGPTDVAISDSLLYIADPPTGRVLKIHMLSADH